MIDRKEGRKWKSHHIILEIELNIMLSEIIQTQVSVLCDLSHVESRERDNCQTVEE